MDLLQNNPNKNLLQQQKKMIQALQFFGDQVFIKKIQILKVNRYDKVKLFGFKEKEKFKNRVSLTITCLILVQQLMKKFEEVLKEKAHLSKIRQAKTTILSSIKPQSKMGSSKVGAQAQFLLQLYDKKSYDAIPAYKLLRMAGLQQYTKGFIQRGYGVNLGKLSFISEQQKKRLYEELKILPGHTIKLDRIIQSLAKSSYNLQIKDGDIECKQSVQITSKQPDFTKGKNAVRKDFDYQKQLERVLNEYTPQSDMKKKTYVSNKPSDKVPQKKNTPILPAVNNTQSKYNKTKYSSTVKDRSVDFKKKASQTSKPTLKKIGQSQQSKRQSLAKLLANFQKTASMPKKKVLQLNLQIDKVKALNRSFDGALMTSTIANIDVQQLVYGFSGYVVGKIIVISEPKMHYQSSEKESSQQDEMDNIQDEVGQILKESFLHPLYKEEVQQQLVCEEDAYSEGQEDQQDKNTSIQKQFENSEDKMMQSSFLGGQSVDFGMNNPIKIFQEPQPSTIDYFKPTIDSVSNFIKNIVLTAKMERQIPIMAAAYLQTFLEKTKLPLTSINYKRILVTVLLLASKIWDDQSFETPSFSKTFPQYSTVLLNQMQKQVVKALDYKLKIDKKQYTRIFFKMRKHTKQNVKSYQNRKLNLKRIRQLQSGQRKDYKSNFMTKRNSF